VRVTHGTPIPAPSQKPFIKTVGTDGRNGTFELRQNSTRRGKPKNVAGAMVFTYTGPNAPQDINAWKFATATTKTTIELPFPPSATGDTVWVTAFWQNAKDESGPAANPVSVNLPAGGMLPKETVEAMKIAA